MVNGCMSQWGWRQMGSPGGPSGSGAPLHLCQRPMKSTEDHQRPLKITEDHKDPPRRSLHANAEGSNMCWNLILTSPMDPGWVAVAVFRSACGESRAVPPMSPLPTLFLNEFSLSDPFFNGFQGFIINIDEVTEGVGPQRSRKRKQRRAMAAGLRLLLAGETRPPPAPSCPTTHIAPPPLAPC